MALVNARGVIDAHTVAPFARELDRSTGAGATRVLVDLSRADDVAAAGLNTLLAMRQRLLDRGGKIAIVTSPAMGRRFAALGLDGRFLLAGDRMQAARLLGLADPAPSQTDAPRPHAHAA